MIKNLTFLLFVCLFASISTNAQTAKPSSMLTNLLDLPAPPAIISVKEKPAAKPRPEEFYDEKKIPSDDAPIEDLLDYWREKGRRFDEFRLQYQTVGKIGRTHSRRARRQSRRPSQFFETSSDDTRSDRFR